MPTNILRSTYNFDGPLTYIPKVGTGPRAFNITRSTSTIGTAIKPLVLADTEFFSNASFPSIIAAMANTGMRDWDNPATPIQPAKATITGGQWMELRGRTYANTEMIGSMLVRLAYTHTGSTAVDFLVSAAPNCLFKAGTGYSDHIKGSTKNSGGTQIHSEMFMCAQMEALMAAMRGATETPAGGNRGRAGLSAGTLEIDAQMYIEKGSLCDGCRGTWNQFSSRAGEGVTVRFRC